MSRWVFTFSCKYFWLSITNRGGVFVVTKRNHYPRIRHPAGRMTAVLVNGMVSPADAVVFVRHVFAHAFNVASSAEHDVPLHSDTFVHVQLRCRSQFDLQSMYVNSFNS